MPGLKTPNSVHLTESEKVPHSAVVFYQVTKNYLFRSLAMFTTKSIKIIKSIFEITLIMADPT